MHSFCIASAFCLDAGTLRLSYKVAEGQGDVRKRQLLVALVSIATVLFVPTHFKADGSDSASPALGKTRSEVSFKVVIDPGHGGVDVGAVGASGRYEKDFTLVLAQKVTALLEQEPGIEVFMTRTDDRFISQTSRYRPAYANDIGADVLISIHANTYSDPSVSGTETFYYHAHSRTLANIIQRHVARATGFRNRGSKRSDFFILTQARMPAVLVEVGYLTNPDDETMMWTDAFQQRVAAAIVEAVKEYRRMGRF